MNLYATPTEIKEVIPDSIRSTTTTYDNLLYKLADRISRMIDRHCGRTFFPYIETRYFDGNGGTELWIPDLLELTTASYSTDLGNNYTDYTANDYILSASRNINGRGSYTRILGNLNSDAVTGYFPAGQRSVKIVGVWGTTDDRNTMWENTSDTVEDNPLSSSATSLTVNDVDGVDLWGITPRIEAGNILKIESEFLEVTATNTSTQVATVVRGRNGSTAAAHVVNTVIYAWRVAEDVKQAAIIQAIRSLERGFQGFGDTRGNTEFGQMFQLKQLDPEAQMLLQPWVWFGD